VLPQDLDCAVGMADLYLTVWKMKFDLVVFEAVDLNDGDFYIDAVGKSDLVYCFFFEVVENGLIGQCLF
jgi:hypothetical protein